MAHAEEEEEVRKKRKLLWFIAGAVAGVFVIVLWVWKLRMDQNIALRGGFTT